MIHLILEDNGTRHDDLVLVYPGGEHRCDTYYYAIDGDTESDDEPIDAARRVLHAMLAQWVFVVEQAEETDTVYLPFDFSDECTGWIRCRFEGEKVHLDVGWSRIEGWRFSPSDIVSIAREVSDFGGIENASPIAADRHTLATAIKDNMREYE